MDWRDTADRMEPALANEPTEKMQANEATEPIERIDPAEPILRIEPEEPIERIDPLDPMLRIEPAEPPCRPDLPLIPMPRFSQPVRQCPSRGFRSSSEWKSRKGGSGERPPDGEAMIYTLSYQQYRYERGLTTAEQRAADLHAGENAAAVRDLRARLGRSFRLRRRVRPARGAADTLPAPVRFLSSAR